MAQAEAAERRAAAAEARAAGMLARLGVLAGAGDDNPDALAADEALARVEERVRELGEELGAARAAGGAAARREAELRESLDIAHQVIACVWLRALAF